MKLEANKWYKVKFENGEYFISDLIDSISKADTGEKYSNICNIITNSNAITTLTSGYVDHLYIRWKLVDSIIRINYRTNYDIRYMDEPIEYKTTDKEEKEMSCQCKSEAACSNAYSELLDMEYNKRRSILTLEKEFNQDAILLNSEVGKAAKIYRNAIITNCSTVIPPNIKDLVSYSMLTTLERNEYDKYQCIYENNLEELNKLFQTINSLLNICDTYEQKLDILVRYGILELPKKTRK